jgi:hypothetical protein
VQKRGFAGARLAGQIDVLVRVTDVVEREIELWVANEAHSSCLEVDAAIGVMEFPEVQEYNTSFAKQSFGHPHCGH